MENMNDILSEESVSEVTTEPVEQVSHQEEQPVAKAAPESEVRGEEMTAKEKAYYAAAREERSKRQEIERELQTLRQQRAAPSAPTPAHEQPASFWDDPEATMTKWQTDMKAMVTTARLDTAETIARSKYSDFDEKVESFAEILSQNPGLHSQWLAAPDPAEFAYKIGGNALSLKQVGSIDEMRKQIEAETRTKVELEYKQKRETASKERAALPGSLSDARGVSMQRGEWAGPTSLDDIVK